MTHLKEYEIALSFAGEDRTYVEETAVLLRDGGIRVFYDTFESDTLWGKNLYEHLSDIYANKALYSIIFISMHYAEKLWCSHELRSMQERAFKENREYILPARFDETQIPGVLETTGYIDLTKHSPQEFSEIVINKLRKEGYLKHTQIDALQHALLSDASAGTRAHSAIALGDIGNKRAVKTLTIALLGDKDAGTRAHSAIALGKIGNEEAVDALNNAISNDTDAGVKAHCARSLGAILSS